MSYARLRSTIDYLRDRYAPVTSTSTFRTTGQLTPEEFLIAGDFLTYKFPSWSWAPAASPAKRVSYLPPEKQYLVTRGVPCHRRLGDAISGAESNETLIKDFLSGPDGDEAGEDGGWLSTGGDAAAEHAQTRDVRTLDGSGKLEESVGDMEDEIPDMEEDDEDEAIIRDRSSKSSQTRTYNVYITYTPYYRTPRLYLSGYTPSNQPLPPRDMMDDIVGDYTDKTVTLEDFPFFDAATPLKMASIHPCKHASVMKVLLDRADAALKLRRERLTKGAPVNDAGMEGLVDDASRLSVAEREGVRAAGGNGGDEWEVLEEEQGEESAIRVDQYLVVFIKFVSSVTPTIEHDFTMGV